LPGLYWRFSAAERREAAVASGAARILFFLIGGTIYFGVNLIGFGNSGHENCLVASTVIFFREQLALRSALNIGACVVSIRHQN
jgi:hypothetical protein